MKRVYSFSKLSLLTLWPWVCLLIDWWELVGVNLSKKMWTQVGILTPNLPETRSEKLVRCVGSGYFGLQFEMDYASTQCTEKIESDEVRFPIFIWNLNLRLALYTEFSYSNRPHKDYWCFSRFNFFVFFSISNELGFWSSSLRLCILIILSQHYET